MIHCPEDWKNMVKEEEKFRKREVSQITKLTYAFE